MEASPLNLSGKRILLTGASSDIGASIARSCAREGAQLILTGRNEEKLQSLRDEVGRAVLTTLRLDLTADDVGSRLLDPLRPFLPLSGFVHVAGHHNLTPLRVLSREKMIQAMAVNYFSAVEITKLLSSRGNYQSEGCSIIFISSIAAHRAQVGLIAYSASKSALGRSAAGLARELAPKNIRVNTVVPGWVQTAAAEAAQLNMSAKEREHHIAQYPLGLGSPNDIANAVLFLLSPMSSWITGTELLVDGGYTA